MEGIPNIIKSITSSDSVNLQLYLKALQDHQSFRLKGAISVHDPIVQHITSLLCKPSTRYEGLLVLLAFLEQCPLEIIEQKGSVWASLSLKACNALGSDSAVYLGYDSLRILAEKSKDIPEFSKHFSCNVVIKICEALSNTATSGHFAALKCVETCLKLYSGPCRQTRAVVEMFLVKFVDNTNDDLVKQSGKCFHLLQQIKEGGVQGVSQKNAWQTYQIKLLGNLHQILDSLYTNCCEVYDGTRETEYLNLSHLNLSDEPVKRASQLVIRFKNIISYLIIALRDPFPVTKAIMPRKILNLLTRAFGVNCEILQKNGILDNLAIGALLPDMHVFLFKLIDAMVLTMKSNLAMYYKTILRFIGETLKWTSSKNSLGFQKPYGNLRISAYNTLSLWCATMKFGSCTELIAEEIVEQIQYDIVPFRNEFTLKILGGAKKHLSKKARRQFHKAQNEKSNLTQTHSKSFDPHNTKVIFSDKGNQSLCEAGLKCLKNIILSSSCFMKAPIVKRLHEIILNICIELNENCDQKDTLYSNYMCRLALYDILNSILLSPHPLCPPPIQMGFKLLEFAHIRDCNFIVREKCWLSLKNLEKILHPQKECLFFPLDMNDIRDAFKGYETAKQNNITINSDDDDEEPINLVASESSNDGSVEFINSSTVESVQHSEEQNIDCEIVEVFAKDNEKCTDTDNSESYEALELLSSSSSIESSVIHKNIEDKNKSDKNELAKIPVSLHVEKGICEEPVAKKAKFHKNTGENEFKNVSNETENVDELLLQIASTFVDELNDDNN